MDRGACQATVHGVSQSRDTERLTQQFATFVFTRATDTTVCHICFHYMLLVFAELVESCKLNNCFATLFLLKHTQFRFSFHCVVGRQGLFPLSLREVPFFSSFPPHITFTSIYHPAYLASHPELSPWILSVVPRPAASHLLEMY